jgi:hypothetical protein
VKKREGERERERVMRALHFLLARVFPDATLSPLHLSEREREKERD